MKKLLLLIIVFLCSGCYDYHEINDISIATAIGIDYHDSTYTVTIEVLNNEEEKDSGKISAYTITSSNQEFSKALELCANKLNNKPIYSHVRLMVINKNAFLNINELIDYFLRSNTFRENFFVVATTEQQRCQ